MTESRERQGQPDRIEEIAEALANLRIGFAVLFGKSYSGKTDTIRQKLIPLLALKGPVYFGECGLDLPPQLQGPEGNVPVDWGAAPAGTIFLDDFDYILELPDRQRRETAKKLAIAAQAGTEARRAIVLIMGEDNLRSVFALHDLLPGITDNLFELPSFSLEDCLINLAQADIGSKLSYAPVVLNAFQKDLENFRHKGFIPALSYIIHERLKDSPGRPITMAEYRMAGRLNGILREYLDRQLDALHKELGEEAAEAGKAVLEEVAAAQTAGIPPKLQDIPVRLGLSEQKVRDAAYWLEKTRNLISGLPSGKFEMRPAQMGEILERDLESQRFETESAQGTLEEALRAWRELGILLPEERFLRLHSLRKRLRVTQDQAVLMTFCALHQAADASCESSRYWLARIPDRSEQSATLLRAVFDPQGEVRARAARLLAGFDEPEVRHKLYRLALEDPDEAVRRQALDSLGHHHTGEFRRQLEEEARDRVNPYRANAVIVMRLFRDQSTADFLKSLADDPASPIGIRSAAIDTLAAMAMPESVDALVGIALEDADPEDREAAASALATIDSGPLQARALENLRKARRLEASSRPIGVRTAAVLPWLLPALAAAAGNVAVHGLALLFLRRFKWAAIFMAVEGLSAAAIAAGRINDSPILASAGIAVLAVNLLACQLYAFRAAQSGGPSPQNLFRTLLALLLIIPNLAAFALIHGLAHMLSNRARRGLMLFGMELLSFACLLILIIYQDLFAISRFPVGGLPHFMAHHLPRIFELLYMLSVAVLFAGSFLWDIIGAAWLILRSHRRRENELQRMLVYRKLMSNDAAAGVVLAALNEPDKSLARWARRIVPRVARAISPNLLIQWMGQNPAAAPRAIVRALAHIKQEASLQSLCGLWEGAAPSLRSSILSVLAIDPSESSLRWFRKLLPGTGLLWRIRYYISSIDYRIRLWPKPLLAAGALLSPFLLLLFIEGARTAVNETRPIIRSIRVIVTSMAEPGWAPIPASASGISREERQVIERSRFLARGYADKSAGDLLEVFGFVENSPEEKFREIRRGLTNSIVILASGSAAATPRAKEMLTGILQDSNHPQRQVEMTEVLLQIANPGASRFLRIREGTTPQDTARALLLENLPALRLALFSNPDAGAMVEIIDLLELKGDQPAVETLKAFILQPPLPKDLKTRGADRVEAHAEDIRTVQSRALESLVRIATAPAQKALADIAKESSSGDVRQDAGRRLQRMLKDPIAEVRNAFNDLDYEKAIDLGEKISPHEVSDNDRAALLRMMGEASFRLSRSSSPIDPAKAGALEDKAIYYLEQARLSGDSKPETVRLQALSYAAKSRRLLESGNPREALENAHQAVSIDPQCDEAHASLGSALSKTGDPEGALKAFDTAIRISPGYAYPRYMKALILTDRRRYPEAEEAATQAIAVDPEAGWPYSLIQRIYVEQNRTPELVDFFEKRIKEHPSSAYLRFQLGFVYHEYLAPVDPSNFSRACDVYRQIRKQFAGRPSESQQADACIAECTFTTGKYGSAEKLANDVLSRTDADPIPMRLIVYAAQIAAGKYGAAAGQLDGLEKLLRTPGARPDFTWTYDGMLSHLRRAGIPDPAKTSLIRLVAAINDCGKTPAGQSVPEVPASLFDENRAALKALTVQQWLPKAR